MTNSVFTDHKFAARHLSADYWEVSNIKKGEENRQGMGGNVAKGVTKSNLEREKTFGWPVWIKWTSE